MLQHLVRGVGLAAVLAAGPQAVWSASPQESAARVPTARVSTAPVWQRVAANGVAAQAIVLKADTLPASTIPVAHAIVVDTSASQTGDYRRHALDVIDSLLASLPSDLKVRLFAADVSLEPLMDEFAAANSAATQSAVQQLQQRVPLGASNLVGSLKELLADLPGRGVSVVYVGDGDNTADLLKKDELVAVMQSCRDRQLPVVSYGVGPQLNLQLLGALAVHTGGNVLFDTRSSAADYTQAQGKKLARAAIAPVWYPTDLQVSAKELTLLPATPLPVRTDRETIYLTQSVLPADVKVTLSSDKDQLGWNLADPTEPAGSAFLTVYTQRAAADGGLNNGLAGLQLATVANDDFQSVLQNMLDEGRAALAKRQPEVAARIAEQVRGFDDDLIEAREVAVAADQLRVQLVSMQAEEAPSAPPAPGITSSAPANPDLISNFEQQSRIRTQKMQLEVSRTIEDARANSEPGLAIESLKRELTTVRAAIDINPEDRSRMLKQLEGELLAATTRGERLQQTRDRMQQRLAQEEAQARLVEQMELDEERLENLIDRVRALMEEGRHGDDAAYAEAQAVAQVAIDLRPGDGTAAAARFDAVAAEQLVRSFRLRQRRSDKFLDTLHQVELSHVPFPDEPPVVFPPAPVWNALSQRRIAKYSSVDLKKNSPREQAIASALSQRTELAFTDQPLSDVIEFLKDYHQIPIWIDQTALNDEGIDPSTTQVTIELSGVSLRSGLRLLLEPQGLTYLIQDEVMKITTKAVADELLFTRVYPVADLTVMIIPKGGGMGGGMMGGMMGGGMGGGMGGMGGGMGGMGGGMGGMGGMGMGGGFPSVAPEAVPALTLPAAAGMPELNSKKK